MSTKQTAIGCLLMLLIAGQLLAQSASSCSTNGVTFDCPDWEIKSKTATASPFTAYESKSRTTLFAFSPNTSDRKRYLMDDIVGAVVSDRYSQNLGAFEVRKSNDFWGTDKFSKHEVGRRAQIAFNAELKKGLHYHVVELTLKGRRVFVGFVYEAASGDQAREWFMKWTGGGMMTATYGLQKLINSITGESIKDYEAPGGPPPMAAPKKKP